MPITIRSIRRLFVDYSHYLPTIRRLFALLVYYSHYSLTIRTIRNYSPFINCLKNSRSDWFSKANTLVWAEPALGGRNSKCLVFGQAVFQASLGRRYFMLPLCPRIPPATQARKTFTSPIRTR